MDLIIELQKPDERNHDGSNAWYGKRLNEAAGCNSNNLPVAFLQESQHI